MNRSDIKTYVDAKRQTRITFITTMVAILIVALNVLFIGLDVEIAYFHVISFGAVLGALLANSDFLPPAALVTKRRLLDVIERQINGDVEALTIMRELMEGHSGS